MELANDEFDQYVRQAMEGIDPQFAVHLKEVPVIVEDMPNGQVCQQLHIADNRRILGLFQGVPLDRRVNRVGGPSQITIYRRNILAVCQRRADLAEKIRKVVVHELGHYLGFSDGQLRSHDY